MHLMNPSPMDFTVDVHLLTFREALSIHAFDTVEAWPMIILLRVRMEPIRFNDIVSLSCFLRSSTGKIFFPVFDCCTGCCRSRAAGWLSSCIVGINPYETHTHTKFYNNWLSVSVWYKA